MSGLIDRGQAALVRRQKQAFGRAVTYTRGAASAGVTAWLGRTLFSRQPTEPGGAAAVWGDRDYLVAVADLAASGFAGLPATGDRITEVIAGTPMTFEAMVDTHEPEARYSDATRTVFRIHTKRVA